MLKPKQCLKQLEAHVHLPCPWRRVGGPQRPCSQLPREHGFEPFDEPLDMAKGAGHNARCSQLCDEDIGEFNSFQIARQLGGTGPVLARACCRVC